MKCGTHPTRRRSPASPYKPATPAVALHILEFTGIATTSPLDAAAGTANTSNAASAGPVAPTATNDLAVGFIAGHTNTQPIGVTAPGYTTLAQQTTSGSVTSIITGYKTVTARTGQSFTGTFGSAMYWAAGIFCFKAAR